MPSGDKSDWWTGDVSNVRSFLRRVFQACWRICEEFMTDTNKSRQMGKKSNSRETKNYTKQENIIRFHFLAHQWIIRSPEEGAKVEAVTDFIFLDSQITVDGDWSPEIKKCLLLGREATTVPLLFNMLSWFVIASVTLPAKVHIVKAMVFPVVMYGCENWTIKKAECQRVDAFELWYWRRFLRVPWTARRSNQSILKEINPNIHWKDWCWSWISDTLATWYKEPTF